jgi:cytochrome c553
MKANKLLILLIVALPALTNAASSAKTDLQRATRAKPDIEHGSALFTGCVSCHGSQGGGQEDGSTPRIAGQHYPVLLKQLVDFRHGKRWDFRMEEQADEHHLETPQDIADVAAYISQLDFGGTRGIGDGERATDGARIFGSRCASCHGPSGEGDAQDLVPRLGGQHYSYLVRQMYDAAAHHAESAPAKDRAIGLRGSARRGGLPGAHRVDRRGGRPGAVTSERLASDVLTGLTTAEARARLETDGFNELPAERRRPLWRIAVGVMREPMFALLMRRQRCS